VRHFWFADGGLKELSLNDFASFAVGSSGWASSLVVHGCGGLRDSIGGASFPQRSVLVESDSCGGHMRRQRANAIRRSLRSCNLLPNVNRPITYDRSVLKLVVSVANSWGNIRRVDATIRRFAWRRSVNRFSALTTPIFGMWQSTRFEQCLDDVMMSWSTPAPAAQAISSSTRSQRFSVSSAPCWGALRSTLAEEC
jgi:hypothetical protein